MVLPIEKALKKVFGRVGPQRWNEDKQDWDFSTGNNRGEYVTDRDTQQRIDTMNEKLDSLTDLITNQQSGAAKSHVEVENFPGNQDVSITDSTQLDVNVTNDLRVMDIALQEQRTEADASGGTLTFSDVIEAVDIYNRDSVAGVFTINSMEITVPADTFFTAVIDGIPSSTVTVSGSSSYIIGRYA